MSLFRTASPKETVGLYGPHLFRSLAGGVLFISVLPLSAASTSAPETGKFFSKHCLECHDKDSTKGGVNLEALKWDPAAPASYELWTKVYDQVTTGEMPPKKVQERPATGDTQSLLKGIASSLQSFEQKRYAAEGRTKLRRLNRQEYERTVHDLLGIDIPLASLLPADTAQHGFDTVAEGLRLSQLQMETYLEAAEAAVDAAIQLGPEPTPMKKRWHIKDEESVRKNLDTPEGQLTNPNDPKSAHKLLLRELKDTGSVVFFDQNYPMAYFSKLGAFPGGKYRIRVSAYGFQTHGENVAMRIYRDDYKSKQLIAWFDMPPDTPRVVETTAMMRRNENIRIQAVNTGVDEKGKNVYHISAKEFAAPGLAVQWMEIEGPIDLTWPPASMKALFGETPIVKIEDARKGKDKNTAYELKPADPKASAKEVLERFAIRAFRRPLVAGEVEPYIKLVTAALDDGQSYLNSMKIGFRALLTAPQFLFLEEHPGRLAGYALASRLSYFLWSTLPDETLLNLAKEGKIYQPEVLRQQTERMLQDPRAKGLVENFTGQWLGLRQIDATSPDANLYPEYDELLRLSMIDETEAYFTEMVKSDLPISNVVDSDFAMLDSRLAVHYGIPGVKGEEIRKVKLPTDSPRGGFLTQASILKVTANGTTSSPVMRGAWVQKNILGLPPSPPPPGVGSIEPDTRGATTVREQLAKHRTQESCAGCHSKIDPPGFALESFDVIGGFRDRYRSQEKGKHELVPNVTLKKLYTRFGQPVDASGALSNGQTFTGIKDYKKLLLQDPGRITESLTEKLLIYATGARVGFSDRPAVKTIVANTAKRGGGLRSLICEIVQSPTFQTK